MKPIVAIPCDRKQYLGHPFHCVGEKYITAMTGGSNAFPILLPVHGDIDMEHWLPAVDGILLTGSLSNINPGRYGQPPIHPDMEGDTSRDAVTLKLIPTAIDMGIPLLGICRGLQEMNVAFGGTLHQALHQVAGYLDHREDKNVPLDRQYAAVHEIMLAENGRLRKMSGLDRVMVNSLHGQGICALADNLAVEARAPDGVIEAIRVKDAKDFALAVQWHPEWRYDSDPLSRVLFASFGAAMQARLLARQG